MIERIMDTNDNIMALRIVDSITVEDSAEIGQLFQNMAAAGEKIKLLLVLDDYPSLNSAEDLLFDMGAFKKHADQIQKMAVVGERAWKETWMALFGLFSGIHGVYFDRQDFGSALEWLREK